MLWIFLISFALVFLCAYMLWLDFSDITNTGTSFLFRCMHETHSMKCFEKRF